MHRSKAGTGLGHNTRHAPAHSGGIIGHQRLVSAAVAKDGDPIQKPHHQFSVMVADGEDDHEIAQWRHPQLGRYQPAQRAILVAMKECGSISDMVQGKGIDGGAVGAFGDEGRRLFLIAPDVVEQGGILGQWHHDFSR